MRIAFISDIHGNAVALEAVLRDIENQAVDEIVVLGDIAYRGPEPQKAIERVRERATAVLKGNADAWMERGVRKGEVPDGVLEMMNHERDWARERVSDEAVSYLKNLPAEWHRTVEGVEIHAFHAAPDSLFDIVLPHEKEELLQQKLMQRQSAQLYLYAHIHLPYVRYFGGKCVANTGSVGLPFDGLPHASYLIADVDQGRFRLTIERVPYDVERVVSLYRAGDYPNVEGMSRVVREAVKP